MKRDHVRFVIDVVIGIVALVLIYGRPAASPKQPPAIAWAKEARDTISIGKAANLTREQIMECTRRVCEASSLQDLCVEHYGRVIDEVYGQPVQP